MKIQEICTKIGTRIFKIDQEMTEKIKLKVGTPQKVKLKMGQFEPPQKFFLFKSWNLSTFFLFLLVKSTKMKVRPYFAVQKVQKLLKTP